MQYQRGTFIANQAQSVAITHRLAPLMLIAGAGTGKTTTLLHRIYFLIEQHKLKPENILTITYTEKAANELKTRIVNSIGSTAKVMKISTFHSFCYNVVQEFHSAPKSPPILMEDGDAIYLFMQNFDKLGPFDSREFVVNPLAAIAKSFIPFINRLRDELIDPKLKPNPEIDGEIITAERIAQLNDLRRIYPEFQKWKKKHNFVDFGDMILDCYKLLKYNKSALKKVQNQYKYIIIDEFQDNNFALNEVVKQIVGSTGQITVVGDEDQVVYSFRGASKYNISAFRSTYNWHKNYLEISLAENFRSTQAILDVANDSISNAKNRATKKLVASDKNVGVKPCLFESDGKNHALLIAKKIKELSKKYNHQDMAVLCRTKKQVQKIAETLDRERIPNRTKLVDYFSIPEIKDLLAWCNLIAETNQQDGSFYRLFSKSIGVKATTNLFNKFSKRDYTARFELIRFNKDEKVQSFIKKVLTLLVLNQKKNAAEMIWEICVSTKIFRPLLEKYEWQDQLALQNLAQFIDRAQNFVARHRTANSLSAFINYMNILHDSNGVQTIYPQAIFASPTVTISTVHGAKGAEYPVVFIPYNRAGSFPLNYKKNNFIEHPPDDWQEYAIQNMLSPKEQHLEEERRLFYVGITRAKELLYLYAPNKYKSVFIKELNENLLKVVTMENNNIGELENSISTIRNKYEKRLRQALGQNQFSIAQELLLAINRLNEIKNDGKINWGESNWEIELKNQLNDTIQFEIPDKLNLSASSIETYQQCPLKYRLSYIDKIPQISSKPQFTFGNIIHKVLEKFHEPNTELSENSLLELLEKNWESLGFDYETQEADFKRQGREILINYFKHLQEHPVNVIEREFQFSFDIDDITINGKIDRIEQGKNGVIVTDYKTSKKSSNAKNSLQLAIYAMFLQKAEKLEFSGLPETTALYFLRDTEQPIRSYHFTKQELEDIRGKIIEVAQTIRQQKFAPCKGFHCDWCDYKSLLCPEWELS